MPRPPKKPGRKKPPNPVAKADLLRRRKAGPMPPKKGKGTLYDREREKAVDPDDGI